MLEAAHDARVSAGAESMALLRRTLLFHSPIAFAGFTPKNNPFAGLMSWYVRSMLSSHGSSQPIPSAAISVFRVNP